MSKEKILSLFDEMVGSIAETPRTLLSAFGIGGGVVHQSHVVSSDGTVTYREFEKWALMIFEGKPDSLFDSQMEKMQHIIDDVFYKESLQRRLNHD